MPKTAKGKGRKIATITGRAGYYPIPIIDVRPGPGDGMCLGQILIEPNAGWVLREEYWQGPDGTRREGTVGRHPNGLLALISAGREADGNDWLHVSISRPDVMPGYADLVLAKEGLIGAHREAYQVFARREKHVNIHRFCLHLWSPIRHCPLPDFTRGRGEI